jgi:nicotinamide mononucleotide transporter
MEPLSQGAIRLWAAIFSSTALEIVANAANALSILLAARNSIHTWWTGILGCALFGSLFFLSRLYADSLLQLFFIVTSAIGWWQWRAGGDNRQALPVTRVAWSSIMQSILAAASRTPVSPAT